jgi:hypothetical protein
MLYLPWLIALLEELDSLKEPLLLPKPLLPEEAMLEELEWLPLPPPLPPPMLLLLL